MAVRERAVAIAAAVRAAVARVTITPFETAIAVLLIASGAASLTSAGLIDPVHALLPAWEAAILDWATITTGLLMSAGVAAGWRGAEIAGLLLLAAVISDRFVLFGYYLGFGAPFAVTGIFDAAVIWAAAVRLNTIRRRQVIIRISGDADAGH